MPQGIVFLSAKPSPNRHWRRSMLDRSPTVAYGTRFSALHQL
jgi:hypothetical protein